MDVIACQRANIAAVAPMGTALGEDQMAILWRLHHTPTLCFDADAAGQRAANNVIDRALPLLKPDRSFKFATVSGGKDPDDVLREQGAGVLRSQFAAAVPFVERLFARERAAAGELNTPEQRAGLKARLRKLAGAIADADLSAAYREDLLGRYEALWPTQKPVYTIGAAAREMSLKGWNDRRKRLILSGATDHAKTAARDLNASPRPLSAALAVAAIANPSLIDTKVELLDAQGFGDERLEGIAKELVRLRTTHESLNPELVRRGLAVGGFDEHVFRRLSRTADKAGAAFLAGNIAPEQAQILWSRAYDLLVHREALERALSGAKVDMERDNDSSTLMKLKAERDLARRTLESGAWQHDEALVERLLH
jgi:DNA primase